MLCSLLLLGLQGTGRAQVVYSSIGTGGNTCGSWIAARQIPGGEQRLADEQWVVGFLSGVGSMKYATALDPLHGVDAEGVWAWIDDYCRSHPLDHISVASGAFTLAHPGN